MLCKDSGKNSSATRRWCEAGVTSRNGGVWVGIRGSNRSYTAKSFCRLLPVYQGTVDEYKKLRFFYSSYVPVG